MTARGAANDVGTTINRLCRNSVEQTISDHRLLFCAEADVCDLGFISVGLQPIIYGLYDSNRRSLFAYCVRLIPAQSQAHSKSTAHRSAQWLAYALNLCWLHKFSLRRNDAL